MIKKYDGSSGSGNIRCQNCGCVFGQEGVRLDIESQRYGVAQKGQVMSVMPPAREAHAEIQCPQCKQTVIETRRY